MVKRRTFWVWLVALATLGSGLLNVYSVIGRAEPQHRPLLRKFFPLEFLHLSQFLTLQVRRFG